jgi:hypothetical protein
MNSVSCRSLINAPGGSSAKYRSASRASRRRRGSPAPRNPKFPVLSPIDQHDSSSSTEHKGGARAIVLLADRTGRCSWGDHSRQQSSTSLSNSSGPGDDDGIPGATRLPKRSLVRRDEGVGQGWGLTGRQRHVRKLMVRRELEPPRPRERQHLKLVRLPIPPSGHGVALGRPGSTMNLVIDDCRNG